MNIALTGATGFVGSHVLAELQEQGHEPIALVRSQDAAGKVAAGGTAPAVVDLHERPAVADLLRDADAAIHTASPGDESSAGLDAAVIDAAIAAFTGTDKPYPHWSSLLDALRQQPMQIHPRCPFSRVRFRGPLLRQGREIGDGGILRGGVAETAC